MLRNGPRSFTPLYFAPEGGGGGGGGSSSSSGGDDAGEGSGGDQGSSSSNSQVSSHLDPETWISRHGDAQRALGKMSQKLEEVESDNAEYREKLRTYEEQMPDDGAVVVDPETVERLNENGFLDTDKPTAEDLVNALEREREARTALENKQAFNEVCRVTGANQEVLEDLDADTLPYEVKEVETEDGTEKQAYVQTEDGEQEFSQYIKNEYPSLADTILNGDGGGEQGSSSPTIPNQPSGSNDSSSSSSGPATDVDEFLQRENENRGRA